MGIKRAVAFAGYSYDGLIFEDVFSYLKELRKFSDYIVAVYDNKQLADSDREKLLDGCVDVLILSPHEEYDFGSYKKGFFFLKEKGILDKVDKLLLCNDSVIFQGRSLEPFFKREEKKDFYGFTAYKIGVQYNTPQKGIPPHIQSYFLSISKEIYSTDWFNNFMMSIQKEPDKQNVIAKYELGISKLISEKGYKKIVITSREEAAGFYEKLGYKKRPDMNPDTLEKFKEGETIKVRDPRFVCVYMEKDL